MKCLFSSLVLLLTPVLSACAVDLDSLLMKSVGGERGLRIVTEMKSVYQSGTLRLNGIPGSYKLYHKTPHFFYMEADMGFFTIQQGYDGKIAWQRDINGHIKEISGFEKHQMLSDIYLHSFSFVVDGRLPGGREYLGTFERNDTTFHRVAFYPMSRDTVEAYFDEEEGLLRFMVMHIDNVEATLSVDDYRHDSGVPIAYHSLATVTGAPITAETTLDSFAFDVPVDPAIFTISTRQEKDFRFPDSKVQSTLEMRFANGHIYVPVAVNGGPIKWFILDSGASTNLLEKAFADSLGLAQAGALAAAGIGGIAEVPLVVTDSILVGDLALLGQVCGVLDLTMIIRQSPFGDQFGGLIGHDFLSRFPVMVDFEAGSLTVFNPDGYVLPEGGREVPCRFTMGVPTVRAILDGIEGDYLIDLGNPFSLILHEQFVQDNEMERHLLDISEDSATLGGVGGSVGVKTATADNFIVGDIALADIAVTLSGTSSGLSGSGELAGNIGTGLLQRFRVLFDYAGSRVILYESAEQ